MNATRLAPIAAISFMALSFTSACAPEDYPEDGVVQSGNADGTDGSATFQLPNPDPYGDGVTSYRVFARAGQAGRPGDREHLRHRRGHG